MLAMAATFAILGWLGVRFNSMMSISPFLVLGIGVSF
jgi:predicted RND superfamily exporter protein